MTEQTTTDEQAEVTTIDSSTEESTDNQAQQNHDCQDHIEFVDFEWVEEAYDDTYVCSVCGAEYRMVYAKAFLLDGDDYSLVGEYTDEIERELNRLRKSSQNMASEGEEANDE